MNPPEWLLKFLGMTAETTTAQRVERLLFLVCAGVLYFIWEKRESTIPALLSSDRMMVATCAAIGLVVLARVVAWAGKRFDRCEQEGRRLQLELSAVTAELASAKARMRVLERVLFPHEDEPSDSDWVHLVTRLGRT